MKKTILLLDDNKSVVEIVRSLLARNGYTVHSSYSAREALDKLAKNEIDIVVTDVMMPEIDGYQFVRKVREIEKYKSVPVIYLTALDSLEDEFEGFMAGADAYLRKPFKARELLGKIEEILSGKPSSGSQRRSAVGSESRRVLVIANDEARRGQILELLAYIGFEGEAAEATPASLSKLDSGFFDLLIAQCNATFKDIDVVRFLKSFGMVIPLILIHEKGIAVGEEARSRAFSVVELPVDADVLGDLCQRAAATPYSGSN
ncbi:MAG: response regulator [Planctomycetaceae bacterium]|nr:response regulator [Planctomycetaceae bacterium]